MPKTCDHTSVGVLVFRSGKLLLIERKRPPFGLAAPAGHVDSHGSTNESEEQQYRQAAQNELEEETGLRATSLKLLDEARMENPCRRDGGTWHYWRIYLAETEGELQPSAEETHGHIWCSQEEMRQLLANEKIEMPYGDTSLELVWHDWFTRLDVVNLFPRE